MTDPLTLGLKGSFDIYRNDCHVSLRRRGPGLDGRMQA